MKKLKLQLQNIDNKIHLLQCEKKVIIDKIQNKKCEHKRIRKGGGGSWSEWPDYGYYDVWYECLDCKKMWNEKTLYEQHNLQKKLEKNIIINTSR